MLSPDVARRPPQGRALARVPSPRQVQGDGKVVAYAMASRSPSRMPMSRPPQLLNRQHPTDGWLAAQS